MNKSIMGKYKKTIASRTGRAVLVLAILIAPVLRIVSPVNALSAPLAAYSFDRMSGSSLFDETGNGDDCTVSNPTNIYLQAGHDNQSLHNNSSGTWVHCTNSNLKPTTAITVMAWVKEANSGYNDAAVAMPRDASSNSWALYASSSKYGASVASTSSNAFLNSAVTVDANWHHMAMTYDGTTAKLYVDGTLATSQALTGSIDYAGNTFPMDLFTDAVADEWTGDVDDVRVYGTALSQSEVQTLMNSPVPNFHTNTHGRSITMSSSQPSATSVTYSVGFKIDQMYSLQTVLVDFCSNSPSAGQPCTAPGGFTVGASPAISKFQINGAAAAGTWTGSSQNSGRTLLVGGSAGLSVVPGDTVTFDVTTVTNPSSVGSFYGRIFTYNFASPTYTATSTDNFKEKGGVALSTASGIGFVFQVPESLQFCVYKTSCGDVPNVVLGHGPGMVLDASQIDNDTANFSISTNALNGVTVYAHSTNLQLANGTYYIHGLLPNGGSATMVAGQEAFGFEIAPANGPIAANYCYRDWGPGDNLYCYDTGMVTGSTAITRQDTPGPVNNQVLTINFAATVSNVTPAGFYQAKMSLIAVGNF